MGSGRVRSVTAAEVRYAILAVQREGNRRLASALAHLDLSPAQAEVLVVLGEHGPLTLKGLGSLLVCESGSPSRLVDVLVRRGVVDRVDNPMDRRQILLQLTKSGRRLLPDIRAVEEGIDASLSHVFEEGISAEMVERMRRFLTGTNTGDALQRRFPQE